MLAGIGRTLHVFYDNVAPEYLSQMSLVAVNGEPTVDAF